MKRVLKTNKSYNQEILFLLKMIIRINNNDYGLTPYSLAKIFACSKEWKEQLRNTIFIQDTIPTISVNFFDLLVPIPKK